MQARAEARSLSRWNKIQKELAQKKRGEQLKRRDALKANGAQIEGKGFYNGLKDRAHDLMMGTLSNMMRMKGDMLNGINVFNPVYIGTNGFIAHPIEDTKALIDRGNRITHKLKSMPDWSLDNWTYNIGYITPDIVAIAAIRKPITSSIGFKRNAGLMTPHKLFGSLTQKQATKVLERKYGKPRYSTPFKISFFDGKKRSFTIHDEPGHGAPHIDINTRGWPSGRNGRNPNGQYWNHQKYFLKR